MIPDAGSHASGEASQVRFALNPSDLRIGFALFCEAFCFSNARTISRETGTL